MHGDAERLASVIRGPSDTVTGSLALMVAIDEYPRMPGSSDRQSITQWASKRAYRDLSPSLEKLNAGFVLGRKLVEEELGHQQRPILRGWESNSAGVLLPATKLILPEPPSLIVAVWESLALQIASGSRELDRLSWKEFEDLMSEILEKSGWYIKPMGYTKDGGIDILAIRRAVDPGVPIEMLVQCKRYSQSRRVGISVVQRNSGLRSGKWLFIKPCSRPLRRSPAKRRAKGNLWKMDLRDHDAILVG